MMKKLITMILALALAAAILPGARAEGNEEWKNTAAALVADTARMEEGTAGASLKQAGLAARWMDLSSLCGLSGNDVTADAALKAEVLSALAGLTAEERTAAQKHFTVLDDLIRTTLSGSEENLALFTDAGVAEDVRKILRQPAAFTDWLSLSFVLNNALGLTDDLGRPADPFAQLAGPVSLAGSWYGLVSQRAGMDVTANADGSYDILVYWGSSASEFSEWKIHGTYDEYSGALFYRDGRYAVVATDDSGKESISEQAVTQGVFLKEGDRFRWIDSMNENSIEIFERVAAQ